MERFHLGERVIRSMSAAAQEPVPLGFVDQSHWVYLVRYRGECAARRSSCDLFALVIEGSLDVAWGEEGEEEGVENFQQGEGFVLRAGERWVPRPEGRGAVVLHVEARHRQEEVEGLRAEGVQ